METVQLTGYQRHETHMDMKSATNKVYVSLVQ